MFMPIQNELNATNATNATNAGTVTQVPRVLNASKAARHFGLKRSELVGLIRAGTVPALPCGDGSYLVPIDAAEQAIAAAAVKRSIPAGEVPASIA